MFCSLVLAQVFQTVDKLQRFLGLRSAYVLHILTEALKINSFHLLCGQAGHGDPTARNQLSRTLARLSSCHTDIGDATEPADKLLGQQLLFFDLAQSALSWPGAWHDLLAASADSSSSLQDVMFDQVPVLKRMEWCADHVPEGQLSLPSMPLVPNMFDGSNSPNESSENKDDQEAHADGKAKVDVHTKQEVESDQKKTIVSLDAIHRFADAPGNTELPVNWLLDESIDAFSMRVDQLDTGFLQMLQTRLQFAVWAAYGGFLRSNPAAREIAIDLSKKGADAVVISKDLGTREKLGMMLAGSVSMYPQGQLGKEHYPLCTLFGVTFYINAPKDLTSLESVIPGWMCKVVSRNDLAYFQVVSEQVTYVLYVTGGDSGLHVQPRADVSERFLSALKVSSAYACAAKEHQDKMTAAYTACLNNDDAQASRIQSTLSTGQARIVRKLVSYRIAVLSSSKLVNTIRRHFAFMPVILRVSV